MICIFEVLSSERADKLLAAFREFDCSVAEVVLVIDDKKNLDSANSVVEYLNGIGTKASSRFVETGTSYRENKMMFDAAFYYSTQNYPIAYIPESYFPVDEHWDKFSLGLNAKPGCQLACNSNELKLKEAFPVLIHPMFVSSQIFGYVPTVKTKWWGLLEGYLLQGSITDDVYFTQDYKPKVVEPTKPTESKKQVDEVKAPETEHSKNENESPEKTEVVIDPPKVEEKPKPKASTKAKPAVKLAKKSASPSPSAKTTPF